MTISSQASPDLSERIKSYSLMKEWWDKNCRPLPWRADNTGPWAILVSEVMSQQTPMLRVVPYWVEWMKLWPTPDLCAKATKAEILTAWGHLGYPSRALRLQNCAQIIVEKYGGRVPSNEQQLLELPGIGPYTASAILSFAFGENVAVLDTNIRRVITRVFEGKESVGGTAKESEWRLARSLLPSSLSSLKMSTNTSLNNASIKPIKEISTKVWNQSLMELGALVCTASKPTCDDCPLGALCLWKKEGYPGLGEKPTRTPQKWKGTNRQVRGIILRALREKYKEYKEKKYEEKKSEEYRSEEYRSEEYRGCRESKKYKESKKLGELKDHKELKSQKITEQQKDLEYKDLGVQEHKIALSVQEIDTLWSNSEQLHRCIEDLAREGFIKILPDGSVTFPS